MLDETLVVYRIAPRTLVAVLIVAIVALLCGAFIADQSLGLNALFPIAGALTIIMIWRSPVNGLFLILLLEVFRLQVIEQAGGAWLTVSKAVGLLTWMVYLIQGSVKGHLRLRRTPLDRPLLAFVGINIISLLWSSNINRGLSEAGSLLTLFGLYYLVVQLMTDRTMLSKTINVLIVATVVLVIMVGANTGWILLRPDIAIRERVGYVWGNPNGLGLWLLLALGPTIARFFSTGKRAMAVVYSMVALVFGYFLLLTGSRAAWLGALLLLVMLSFRRPHGLARPMVLMTGLGLLTALCWPSVVDRFARFLISTAFSVRVGDLAVSWHAFLSSPAFGIGIGDYRDIVPTLVGELAGVDVAPNAPHNLYLSVLAKTGLLGFAALGWIVLRVARLLDGSATAIEDCKELRTERLGLSASLVGYAVYAALHAGVFFNLLWILLGLIGSTTNVHRTCQEVVRGT